MATAKITDLTAYTDPVNTDVLPIVDVGADITKKVSIANLMKNASLGTAAAPSIAFDGDPNTGIYSPGADQVAVATNGTGRLFIDASGNVKVGAPSTAAPFNVQGVGGIGIDIAGRSSDGGAQLRLMNNAGTVSNTAIFGGDTYGGMSSATYLAFQTASSERLRITSAGLVGIGASDPQRPLDVVSNSSAETVTFRGASANNISTLRFNSNNAATNYASIQSRPTFFELATAASVPLVLSPGSGTGVGIGTTSPSFFTDIGSSTGTLDDSAVGVRVRRSGASNSWVQINSVGALATIDSVAPSPVVRFRTSTDGSAFSERARIDSSGRLLVGTSSARSNFGGSSALRAQIEGDSFADSGLSITRNSNDNGTPSLCLAKSRSTGNTVVVSGDSLGTVFFEGNDGSNFVRAAQITAQVDGTPGANNMPGRIVLSTTADGASSPTERMRITQSGAITIGTTNSGLGVTDGLVLGPLESGFTVSTAGQVPLRIYNKDTSGTRYCMEFRTASTAVGNITHNGTSTSYNTSSDYRLKENIVPVADGITRLQQLKPSRFNFVTNPIKTVDGFLAHEVQDVVPEAITGEKDAVDDDGNPIYQGIDQSKLVPLLTAALQEAVAKIESLEARLTAAGI